MRHSTQREVVKANILARYDHPTASEVYDSVRAVLPRISLATVYRHLESFVDEGIIARIAMAEGPDRFDATAPEHLHACCSRCGRVSDVDARLTKPLAAKIQQQTGLIAETIQIVATGLCRSCYDALENHCQ